MSIFISYRRDTGSYLAGRMYDYLKKDGYTAFYDIESMKSGKFTAQIYAKIEEAEDFVLVLSKGALDRCVYEGDWVRLEIEYALKLDKNIVLMITNDFLPPSREKMPKSLSGILDYQGVTSSSELFEASIKRLEKYLITEPSAVQDETNQQVPVYFNLPYFNDWFCGRESELEAINNHFANNEYIQIIHGMGGMGKTQIAVKFVYNNMKSYSMIHWINGESVNSIVDDYRQFLASVNHLPDGSDSEAVCRAYISYMAQHTNWLIVYDNCNYFLDSEFDLFRRMCLPKNNSDGNIIITSRNSRRIGRSTLIDVDIFTLEEAKQFLMQRAEISDEQAAEKLAARLGYFPLALEIAGAYIYATHGCDAEKYLSYLYSYSDMLEQMVDVTDYDKTIKDVILLTLDKIKNDYPDDAISNHIRTFLIVSSFCDSKDVDLQICSLSPILNTDLSGYFVSFDTLDAIGKEEKWRFLKEYADFCTSQININRLTRIAVRYGLLRESVERLEMHELQQEVIRKHLIEKSDYSIWSDIIKIAHYDYYRKYERNYESELRCRKIFSVSISDLTATLATGMDLLREEAQLYMEMKTSDTPFLNIEKCYIRFFSVFELIIETCISDQSVLSEDSLCVFFEFLRLGIELCDSMRRSMNNNFAMMVHILSAISFAVERFSVDTIIDICYDHHPEKYRGKAENKSIIPRLYRQMYNCIVKNGDLILGLDDDDKKTAIICENVLYLLQKYIELEYEGCNNMLDIEKYCYTYNECSISDQMIEDLYKNTPLDSFDSAEFRKKKHEIHEYCRPIEKERSSGFKPIDENDDHRIIEFFFTKEINALLEIW